MFFDTRDGCFDELGLIAHDAKPVARWQRAFELRQTRLDSVHNLDRVGPGLLADLQEHRGIAVDARDGLRVRHAVLDPGDVANLYRVSAGLADNDAPELVRRFHASSRAQRQRLRALVDAPARYVAVLCLESPRYVVHREVLGAETVGVEHDVDL